MTFTGEPSPRIDAPWLVLIPLSAALVALAFAFRPKMRFAHALAWLPIAPALPALGITLLAPSGAFLDDPVARLFRVGFVDLRLAFVADRNMATISVVAIAIAAFVRPTARRSALLALVLFMTLVDDRLLAAASWTMLVTLAVRQRPPRILAGCAVVGAALLFWLLGGSFTGEGYVPDMNARVVAVVIGESAPESGFTAGDRGTFSVRAFPGATLYVDGALVPFGGVHPVASPFEEQPIPVGFHTFRLSPGPAYDDYVVAQVPVDPGQRVTLITAGSTTSLVEARDQLRAHVGESAPLATAMRTRRLFGMPVSLVLAVLVVLASVAAWRLPLLAIGAIALVVPIASVLGPSADLAAVALVVAMPAALVSGRPDVFLALGAALAGAPAPVALALALASWLPDRRAAAMASFIPRALLVLALSGSAIGHVGTVIVLATSLSTMVGKRKGGFHVPKWYVATGAVTLLGASSLLATKPPVWALLLAVMVSVAAFPAAVGWERDRLTRLRDYAKVLRRSWGVAQFVVDGLAAIERRTLGR